MAIFSIWRPGYRGTLVLKWGGLVLGLGWVISTFCASRVASVVGCLTWQVVKELPQDDDLPSGAATFAIEEGLEIILTFKSQKYDA